MYDLHVHIYKRDVSPGSYKASYERMQFSNATGDSTKNNMEAKVRKQEGREGKEERAGNGRERRRGRNKCEEERKEETNEDEEGWKRRGRGLRR